MRGAYGYLIGTIKRPVPITTTFTTSVTNTKSTSPQTATFAPAATISAPNEIETKWQLLTPSEEEWDSRDNWVRGLLLYNTKNPIGLGIKTRGTAADAWTSYVKRYEIATKMARLAAEWDLKNSKYSDGENFSTFITVMRNKWAKANSLGSLIDDDNFKSILLTSLPFKYGVERDRVGRSGMEILWNERFDNKIGTTLASACALCLDLLSHVWLRISGGLNCCQEFRRGVV